MMVYGYCRVSTLAQADKGESLDVQKRKIEGQALQLGVKVDRIFVERGVSGSRPITERAEGRKLMSALKPGDIVIASTLDRAFRSALDALQTCKDLRERKVSLYLLDMGGDVVGIAGNGNAKLFMQIAAAFAEAERDRIRERILTAKADRKEKGRYLGGSVPFGFRVVERVENDKPAKYLEPVTEQQAAIKRIRRLRREGKSLRAIAADMQRRGFKLSHMAVKEILSR